MKRAGILHSALAGHCAGLGHTDRVAVVDCGTPLPAGVPLVDLALVHGVPSFEVTLAALVGELVVEGHAYAAEATGTAAEQWVRAHGAALGEAEVVPHEELKAMLSRCALVVRTGEATPYANVVLRCGVSF